MLTFIGHRLLYLLPVLLAVSLLTFLIASLLPGDLAYVILGDQATPEKVEALRHDMGLDQPIWWRYLSWLGHVLQGDFGRSFRTGQTVLQAVGASHARILIDELLPNVLLPLLAFFLLGVAVTIVVEGALSFLGLGAPPPAPSWGSMIGEGRESLGLAPRLAFMPALTMFLTVLSFNLVGDTLRAMTDPRQGAL
jgi:ABC-type dipeptide/oligopeptide/nickel transport system permease component